MICYSLAFPLFIYFKFSKNKMKIFEDQLLAAQDRGDKAMNTNDHERFRFRKRYAAMYENFKPDCWYWILILLGKKLAICLCGLMFRRNPMFQLSIALIILFTCFTLQVLYRPFMSMEERAEVVKLASKRDFDRGHKMLRKMAAFGDTREIEQAKKRLAMEEQAQLTVARSLTKSSKFFVNYNDVEAVFLACAIFVCVAGIMFASGYFENEYYKAQGRRAADHLVRGHHMLALLLPVRHWQGDQGRRAVPPRKEQGQVVGPSSKRRTSTRTCSPLDNSSATETEKNAASKIEAAFIGKKARSDLHAKIAKDGTPEQKAKLKHLEETRRNRKKGGGGRRRSRSPLSLPAPALPLPAGAIRTRRPTKGPSGRSAS